MQKVEVNIKIIILFFSCITGGYQINAQISPGKLSAAHSHLEGLSNCTQCHEIGKKTPDSKCLSCHAELNNRIKNNKGYHASYEIKGKECISCHSEHHGVKFEMIHFDTKNFKHELTAYKLTGSHQSVDCRKCHDPKYNQNAELKKNSKTYLGLSQKCNTCHEDFHQNTLSSDCASCHQTDKFRPAPLFNHQKSNFALNGAHKNLDCKSCHPTEMRGGKEFQKFSGIAFQSCASCHKDAHAGKFGSNCKACHSEESFQKISGNSGFNHNLTGYKLEGKHKHLDCRSCHDNRNQPPHKFQEFLLIKDIQCVACHKDVHDGKFGIDCKNCHQQESFRINSIPSTFDHDLTTFKLEGKHEQVNCKNCHKTKMTDPVAHQQCNDCHTDYHQGEIYRNAEYKDCDDCHSVQGFAGSRYGLDQHQKGNFPLRGAHQAVDCKSCHLKRDRWTFNLPNQECRNCHGDQHKGLLPEEYYKPTDCRSCHNEDSWQSITSFDHSRTDFALKGKHLSANCGACHTVQKPEGKKEQYFQKESKQCSSCHDNPHGNQFQQTTAKSCNDCHGFDNWTAANFNHDSTRFPLTGEHKVVSCAKCHFPTVVDGLEFVLYKSGKVECKDCHL